MVAPQRVCLNVTFCRGRVLYAQYYTGTILQYNGTQLGASIAAKTAISEHKIRTVLCTRGMYA